MESQADHLGLEYMYKAGYDPTAFLDFFERIASLEKRKPGTLAGVFSSHPPTGERIKKAQKEMQEELEPRPEYVLDTSEFHDVHDRLAIMQNGRKDQLKDDSRPTLRRRTQREKDDERPTLKRRD
jgi:predicted Zn-dependent protease